MARRRHDSTLDVADGDWFPPPWNEPPLLRPEPQLNPPVVRSRRQIARPVAPVRSNPDVRSRRILAISVPQVITGVIALVSSTSGVLSGEGGTIPIAIMLVLAVQLLGYSMARREEPGVLRWSWAVCACSGSIALSLLAIQVTLARRPYAGTEFGPALPLVVATFASALILIFVAIALAVTAHEIPEESGLLFLPLALLVPAAIGIPPAITEARAMQALAESTLLAAGASLLAWSLPRQSRLLVPPVAIAVQFVLLWALDRGPTFPESSGSLVRLLQGGLLALTVILVVALPILAMRVRGAGGAPNTRSRRNSLPDLESLR